MVIPVTKGMASMVTNRQVFPITIGNMVMPTTTDRIMPIGTAAMTTDIGLILNVMYTTGTAGTRYIIRVTISRGLIPEYTRLSQVVSVTLECLVASDFEEHLLLHLSHQKTSLHLSRHHKCT